MSSLANTMQSEQTKKLAMPEMVLIDLDGTLVDTAPDLALCVDLMMERLGMPKRGEEATRKWIGNGVARLVKRALVNSTDGEPDEMLYKEAHEVFLDLYKENVCVKSQLFPGVKKGLSYLQEKGLKIGCVTNKPEAFTIPLLKKLGIYDVFGIVVSGDTLPAKKPDPAPLLHAAEFFGVKPQTALLIGDSINDVQAARAAGFMVVCVPYGYNHGQDINDAKPDAVIETLGHIQDVLN